VEEIAAWLRKQAEEDKAAAERATDGPWSIDGMTVRGTTRAYSGAREGEVLVIAHTWPQESGHITRHDPRTEGARAESVLAVLGEYDAAVAVINAGLASGMGVGPGGTATAKALRRTVGLLARGYRFRPGYDERWKP
jgi:hypothetical protein